MFDAGRDPTAVADIEANKAAVRRLYYAFAAVDTDAFDQLIAADYAQHNRSC